MNKHKDIVEKLGNLIDNNRDAEAYVEFDKYFNTNPLIKNDGDDTELAIVCNPIGLAKFHLQQKWGREINWWDAVLHAIEKYEQSHNINLHKGLPYHNKALPLLELNKPEDALKSLLQAYEEDLSNFPNDSEQRPAYKILCFLLPIIEVDLWKNGSLSTSEKDFLIECFSYLFQSNLPDPIVAVSIDYLKNLSNKEMSDVLVNRYNSISDDVKQGKYPGNPISLSGSIIEGVLETLLGNENITLIQNSFSRIYPKKKSKNLKKWSFEEKIEVARDIGILHKQYNASVAILCHLLRDSRNIIHPARLDKIGRGKLSKPLSANLHIASMLKTALDVVLNSLDQHNKLSKMNTPRSTYTSLASPSQPGHFDAQGIFHPSTPTQTSTSTSQSSAAMGSSTSTTTT
ncbi:hypothetical protein M1523_01605 [Patescibacteria group bacterium]|nr:hypothetical protein [Patescibacteria group bacterium]